MSDSFQRALRPVAVLLILAAAACGGRSEPVADSSGPATVLQVSVPAGVTSAVVARVRSIGGVSAVASVGMSKVTAVGDAGKSVGLTLATVVPDQFAPLAPVLIGAAETGPLSDGSVLLAQAQREQLGVAPGDSVRLVSGYVQRMARVAALDVTTFADGIVSSGSALPAAVKPTLLLVGVAADADRVASEIAQRLGQSVALSSRGPSFLYGRGVSRLFGSFSYVVHPDGRISASPEWARTYIRSRDVAILGTVTCHRLMLPQLARAMREIELRGLAKLIDRPQYGGCYVARTILWDPSNPPSMHAWGLAIDLNVSTNGYGARPTMDPRIVAIFEKWGFAWGGRWKTPDGMHFELAALLKR